LFLIFNYRQGKFNIIPVLENRGMGDESTSVLPGLEELLDLEKLSRKEGSGINFTSLIGLWKFVWVSKKTKEIQDPIASYFLRIFSASLVLNESQEKPNSNKFDIINSIQFGSLFIRFVGAGELKGSQPILSFFFKYIELKLGEKVLFKRLLEMSDEEKNPYFVLIAMDSDRKWLSARGRGGGLALWLKD